MVISILFVSQQSACLYLMEDSMSTDVSPLRPQNYLFCCKLKSNKGYHFKMGANENKHITIKMVILATETKDELHIIEAEAMN